MSFVDPLRAVLKQIDSEFPTYTNSDYLVVFKAAKYIEFLNSKSIADTLLIGKMRQLITSIENKFPPGCEFAKPAYLVNVGDSVKLSAAATDYSKVLATVHRSPWIKLSLAGIPSPQYCPFENPVYIKKAGNTIIPLPVRNDNTGEVVPHPLPEGIVVHDESEEIVVDGESEEIVVDGESEEIVVDGESEEILDVDDESADTDVPEALLVASSTRDQQPSSGDQQPSSRLPRPIDPAIQGTRKRRFEVYSGETVEDRVVANFDSKIFLYNIPPNSNNSLKSADWKFDTPHWFGKCKLIAKGNALCLVLEDSVTKALHANCPIDAFPGSAVEAVTDSSRYFVIRLQNDAGQSSFHRCGFADPVDSVNLTVALQDHFKYLEKSAEKKFNNTGPSLDLASKSLMKGPDGQPAPSRPRPSAPASTGGLVPLLPPPPTGGSAVRPRGTVIAPKSAPARQGNDNFPTFKRQASSSPS